MPPEIVKVTREEIIDGTADRLVRASARPAGPRYSHILSAFYSTPLAMMPEKIEAVRRFLHAKAAGGEISAEDVAGIVAARHKSGAQLAGRVAIVECFGVLSQRVGMMEEMSGGVSCEAIGAQLDSLAADKTVKAIVLAFDSPGGSVFGITELGAKIRALKQEKKIVGLADSVAASAAYWLAAQCTELNVTPGGQVGSIGVYGAHEDLSGLYEQEGVKVTLVSAGDYKTEGNPFGPLGEDAKAEMQSKVDHYYGEFVAAVAKGRGVTEANVKANFGKGRMVTAADAVSRGMADRVATVDQVLRRLGAESPAAEGAGVPLSAALARARAVEIDG